MTTSIGIVGSSTGVVATPVPSTVTNSSSNFSASLASTTSAATSTSVSHSPRVVQDPTVGFITQYLSANGSEVVSQTPSAITVAYLRVGLTAQGDPKAAAPHAHATTTA